MYTIAVVQSQPSCRVQNKHGRTHVRYGHVPCSHETLRASLWTVIVEGVVEVESYKL